MATNLYSKIENLPLTVDGYALEGLAFTMPKSDFERLSTVIFALRKLY